MDIIERPAAPLDEAREELLEEVLLGELTEEVEEAQEGEHVQELLVHLDAKVDFVVVVLLNRRTPIYDVHAEKGQGVQKQRATNSNNMRASKNPKILR